MGLAAKINRGARRKGQRWIWGVVGAIGHTRNYDMQIYGRDEASPRRMPPRHIFPPYK